VEAKTIKSSQELLDGPDIVTFIKFKRLQWAGHIVQMDNSRISKKSTGWKIPWKKTCGKTMTEVGRQHQEGLAVAAEHKRMEKMGMG
jgi:hypothetical protein